MKIHEYQAKEILREFGVSVLDSVVCHTPEEAGAAFTELGGSINVVKAQIHAGGRGLGGGVKLVKSADEAVEAGRTIMSKNLITHQTGPEGQPVKKLLVESGCDIKDELYVGIAVDRKLQQPVVMASAEGGVEIEEVAAKTPEKILKEGMNPTTGLTDDQAARLARGIGIPDDLIPTAVKFFQALGKAFLEKDCALAEINPLVVTGGGEVIALDAKMTFDDNALFRQPQVVEMRDLAEEDAAEVEAAEHGLSYVNLDGNIGCLVNGAGLAMATMDIIKFHGGEPANFLDVGGGATADQVAQAFRIILRDDRVKGILVNIFGGILSCKTLANGIIQAVRDTELDVPLVVRLEGTEVKEGRALLEASGLAITTAADMADAADKVCSLVTKGSVS